MFVAKTGNSLWVYLCVHRRGVSGGRGEVSSVKESTKNCHKKF